MLLAGRRSCSLRPSPVHGKECHGLEWAARVGASHGGQAAGDRVHLTDGGRRVDWAPLRLALRRRAGGITADGEGLGRARALDEASQQSTRPLDIALANYEKAIQIAFREVADALAGRATLAEQLRAQQAQARAAQTTFELADLRYRNGAASYLDVLDAQRSLFAAQQATVQVRAAQVQNLVALYKSLGGGWTPPSATR